MSDKPCQICGASPAVLYACGVRCPDHTPAKLLGIPEPPQGYGAQFRAEHLARQAALNEGRALREQGVQRVEQSSGEWDRKVVDQAIKACAAKGRPFSANDCRELLPPGIRRNLIGARFLAASRAGVIRRVGDVASSDAGTHAHRIGLWEAA